MKTKADKIQRRVVNNYIKSRNPNQHDINTYVAAVCKTQNITETNKVTCNIFFSNKGTHPSGYSWHNNAILSLDSFTTSTEYSKKMKVVVNKWNIIIFLNYCLHVKTLFFKFVLQSYLINVHDYDSLLFSTIKIKFVL